MQRKPQKEIDSMAKITDARLLRQMQELRKNVRRQNTINLPMPERQIPQIRQPNNNPWEHKTPDEVYGEGASEGVTLMDSKKRRFHEGTGRFFGF